MHNRKEGALVLLAAHGGGLVLAAQKWFELLPNPELETLKLAGAAVGLFGFGAVSAYAALRNSGDDGFEPFRALSEAMSIVAIAGAVLIVFVYSQLARLPAP